MKLKGININLNTFRDNFKISISSISKATKILEDYIKSIKISVV